MKFQTKSSNPNSVQTDLLVVFALAGKKEGEMMLTKEAAALNTSLDGLILTMVAMEKYEAGAVAKTFVLYPPTGNAKRVIVAGLGDLKKLSIAKLQLTAATIARRAKSMKAMDISIALSQEILDVFGAKETAQSFVEGFTLGSYTFLKHKEEARKKDHAVGEVTLFVSSEAQKAVSDGVEQGTTIASGVTFARDLVNEPPSVTTPTYLGDVALSLAKKHKSITAEVFGKADIKRMGMGGILGIASGSDEEPKFIRLNYKGTSKKTITIIGKGITFDTGGLSLKPAGSMETMKLDMAGAAAILGVFSVLPMIAPEVNVVGLISATENMPGPKAVKPGDIVTAMNGKTIEILNTDAEGRVVLADALSYAVSEIKPDAMIDLATLTGACVVALGEEVTGLFASHQALADALLSAAKESGESLWQLPLVDEYREQMKSVVADVKNIGGGRWGGAITAALFLQEFTDSSIPWAHLDIAGPAFAEKDAPLTPWGGTGHGVRLLVQYLLKLGR
jgi:leucyl aminopeptidase